MNKALKGTLLAGLVIAALLLAVLVVGAAEYNILFLPFISGNISSQRGPLPTPAPTACPGWFENGVCDPTPTPHLICIPDGCP